MLAFGIFLGLVITKVKSANMVSSDTVISVFSSAAMALGIVILSARGGFAKYSSYLIGDILTVGRKDLWTIGIVLVAAYVLWALLYNQLLLLSVNRSLAASRGVRVMLVENIFVIMVAVAVMVSIRWVGILMINSLLIRRRRQQEILLPLPEAIIGLRLCLACFLPLWAYGFPIPAAPLRGQRWC